MFAILRTKRIKDNGAVGKALAHNLRLKYKCNIDSRRSNQNEILIDALGFKNASSENGYSNILEEYYKTAEAKQKGNSVKAMEFVLTASPEFFKQASPKQLDKWKAEQMLFAKKEFGDKLQFAILHMDETTPHIHLIVSVEEKKLVKYKNRYGSGEKIQTSLNARKFNREYLRDLQTRYAEQNKIFGLNRGLRNSKATHRTLQEFYSAVGIATKKDYSNNVRKQINKIIEEEKNIFGYISAKRVEELLTPVLSRTLKKVKLLKTAINFNTPHIINELTNLLKEKENIKELRGEYVESIKNYELIKEENKELKEKIQKLTPIKPKPENKMVDIKIDRAKKI